MCAFLSSHIAKNTLLLYLRMAVIMVVNLLAVRVVLQALGEEDYGIFNAVAGIVLILNSVSTTLSVATQRFFSIARGKNQSEEMQKIFSASVNIFLGISLAVVIIGESVGLWLVNTHLSIPVQRMTMANWVYQFSIVTFILTMFQQPYIAASLAHEQMQYFSLISTIECVLKLGAAIAVLYLPWDRLGLYGGLLMLIAILSLALYMIICRKQYSECRYARVRDKDLHYQMLKFSGWSMFGSVANMGTIQVVTILTSAYFGPIVTAARAIALQIFNALNAFCSSFCMALRPPMMEAVAAQDDTRVQNLYRWSSLFIFVSMCAIAVPLVIFMPDILQLWLGRFNQDMIVFSRLIIIYAVVISMNNPITIWMQALGLVKEYHLPVESVMMLCIPLTWILYANGLPAASAYWGMIIVAIVAHGVRVICLKHYAHFSKNE